MSMFKLTQPPTQRVIVADNDVETTRLIAELLTDEGFTPLCYPAWLLGVACIERAQANLLIFELGPGDAGVALDLVRQLRRSSQLGALPVIILSTDDRLLMRMEQPLRELGCSALAKPFDLDEFVALIRTSLDMNRGLA